MTGPRQGASISYMLGARQPTLAREAPPRRRPVRPACAVSTTASCRPPPAAGRWRAAVRVAARRRSTRRSSPGPARVGHAVGAVHLSRRPGGLARRRVLDPAADSWRLVYQVRRVEGGRGARRLRHRRPAPSRRSSSRRSRRWRCGSKCTMAADATVSLAEWRVGGDPQVAAAADLNVNQTFALNDDDARLDGHAEQPRHAAGRDRRSRGAVQLRRADRRARRHLHARSCCATRTSAATDRWSTGSAATASARTSS